MPLTVLLVDDDQEFLDVLAERLAIRDMAVRTANSAKAALALLIETSFAVVLLDLEMPEMDGLAALKAILALNPGQKVLLLTGHATVASGVRAMQLGAMDVVEKPADIRDLAERIRAVAGRAEAGGGKSPEQPPTRSGFSLRRLFGKKG